MVEMLASPRRDHAPLVLPWVLTLAVAGGLGAASRAAPPAAHADAEPAGGQDPAGARLRIATGSRTEGGLALARRGSVAVRPDVGTGVALAGIDPCGEQAKLSPSDGAGGDQFAYSVSIFGDTAVVGAYFNEDAGAPDAGAAYVYERSGGAWTFVQKLLASDGAAMDFFGGSVSISAGTIVVGANVDDNVHGSNAGAAYVYERSGGRWTERLKLMASDGAANDQFGTSVSVDGDTVVVGAIGISAGAAYVYERSGSVWTEQQKLLASDGAGGDQFGGSVSISGDTIVVGARGNGSAGSAYAYVRTGGTWMEQQKLVPSDGAAGDLFGNSVSISGDSAMVGAVFDDNAGGMDAGSAYVYLRSGGTWTEQQKLVASDPADQDWFGRAVSISGDTAVAGAPMNDNAGGIDAGSAYVFVRSAAVWTEQQKLVASDPASLDRFGNSVSVSLHEAVVGAVNADNDRGPDVGSAYVFVCYADVTPACDAGADVVQQCDGVQLRGMASDPNGDALTIQWTTTCGGATFWPSAGVLDPIVTFGNDCNVSCDLIFTVDDGNGNVCEDALHVDVDDTTPPSIACPDPVTVECIEDVPAADPSSVAAFDNCDGAVTVTHVRDASVGGRCPEYIMRTYRATDACGNTTDCTQTITVDDVTPPGIACPGPVTVECIEDVPSADPSSIMVSDNCDAAVIVTHVRDASDGRTCPETITRTYRARDACGNFTECSQAITVGDVTPPVLSGVPADGTVECDAVPAPATPTAGDNCDLAPRIDFAEVRTDGRCQDAYTLTRTWTATDRCDNASIRTQIITVQDMAAPVLSGVPADATVECDAVPAPATPTAADNCDPAPRIGFSEGRTDGRCQDTYTLARTWTATDRCDNASSQTQVITVQDTTAPVLTGVPTDETVECDAVPAPATPTADDNCDPAPRIDFAEVRTDGRCTDTYTLARTWTATDRCDNASSKTQMVTVQDTTAPVLGGVPADTTVECDAVPAPATPTATDNCDPGPRIDFTETRRDGRCPGDHVLTRTWTATDRCDNAKAEVQIMTVVDTTPPVITPGSSTLYCLWPPNHEMAAFRHDQFSPEIRDACSDPVTWRFADCASDQPANDIGDGNTEEDCILSPNGLSLLVRAERQGTQPLGRHYGISVVATDACGNASDPTVIGRIYVPHEQSLHETCTKTTHGNR